MNCDKCKCYHWYFDWCDKWECKVDGRAVHNCFEEAKPPKDSRKQRFGGGIKKRTTGDADFMTALIFHPI